MLDDPEIPMAGVTRTTEGKTCWRVWAPKAGRVDLILGLGETATCFPMAPLAHNFFEHVSSAPIEPGTRYAYRLDGGPLLPDPASRFQPDGIHAPSAVWFPGEAPWNERGWQGLERSQLVVYEIHVGTFTPEGTFDAVIPRIDELLELGITAIELMPVAQFPGTRSWGYDGVFPFAPQHSYGGPDGLRRLIEACHQRGMGIILDVVYNHFGPEGSVFSTFGNYLTDAYQTSWGLALNFDGRGCDAVRAYVIENARQWIRDYHVDGLRLDAADQIFDRSPRHILAEITEAAHREATRLGRIVHVFAETDLNDAPRFLHPIERGGYGLDGHWNDDFHHAAHVVLTQETKGYYIDFAAGPEALAKSYERVFVNDGNYSEFRGRRHGAPATEFSGDRFLAFTQNHDQIGNRLRSDRNAAILTPAALRLAAGILLFAPRIPLLFMGEEYGETRPFPFFCDFQDQALIQAVRDGRKAEFSYLGWNDEIPDPLAETTSDSAILSWSWTAPERAGLRTLYQDLFQLRRTHPMLRDFSHARTWLHGHSTTGVVLEIRRGRSTPDAPSSSRIYLNLSQSPGQLPEGWENFLPCFRSEILKYGGPGHQDDPWNGKLHPYEFVLLNSC